MMAITHAGICSWLVLVQKEALASVRWLRLSRTCAQACRSYATAAHSKVKRGMHGMHEKKKETSSTALLFAPALNFLLGCQTYHRQLCNRRSFIRTDTEHQTCTIQIYDESFGGGRVCVGGGAGVTVSACSHMGRVVSAF